MTDVSIASIKDEAGRFKAAFDEMLHEYIETTLATLAVPDKNPSLTRILNHLSVVTEGGKRLRPFMVYRLYAASHEGATPGDIREVLLAVELFHIFCLIHDDVMDEASRRHGAATLHAFATTEVYANTPLMNRRARAGESHAILVGDLVFNLVMELLHATHERGLPQMNKVQKIFHTLVTEVCLGQMLDIDFTVRDDVREREIVEKNTYKTAYYSFVRPLQIGATLAGHPEILPVCETFGRAVGQLYQLQDDLLDLMGDPAETKKDTMGDLVQNQHTIITTYVRERGGSAAALLDGHVGRPLSDEEKATLREMFITSGAVAYTESQISTHRAAAEAVLHDPLLTDGERALFSDMLTLLTKRSA